MDSLGQTNGLQVTLFGYCGGIHAGKLGVPCRKTKRDLGAELNVQGCSGLHQCDLNYAVSRKALEAKLSHVSVQRTGPLVRTIMATHGWAAWM